jgi:beta-xylosidase
MSTLSIILVATGLLILATNFVDVQYIISKLFFKNKKKDKQMNTESDNEEGFLEIVSLWYQLKTKCDTYNLKVASDKLDEVFPLLNKVIEEDNNVKVS